MNTTTRRPRTLLLTSALLLSAGLFTSACDLESAVNNLGPDDLCSDGEPCEPTVPPPPKLPIRDKK
ncbi:MAG: hypothetical protein H6713_12845 [Myxococcales bacterium]|nr:hypothetical protein [Myxococcales bacterium]